jgi:large subunit ribosomal protein L3
MKGILGRKIGMTQVFTTDGVLIPVTVIKVTPNVVMQIKTKEKDGYDAIQIGFEDKPERLANKPELGHAKRANTTPKRFLKEIRDVDVNAYEQGQEITLEIFSKGELVDVTGTSKGKGFQGVIKRHKYSRGPETHGSRFHRRPGSLGALGPLRVFKGTKLPGRMGGETVTIQNLEIIDIDLENNIILVKGNVPGPKKSVVFIKENIKKPGKINTPKELVFNKVEEAKEEAVETNEQEIQEVTQNEEPVEEKQPEKEENRATLTEEVKTEESIEEKPKEEAEE